MAELRSSTSDGNTDGRLAAEAQRHRDLLRGPIEEYRRRVALQAQYLRPVQRSPLVERAEERIADLMIDPARHRHLDIEVYQAVRDGWPARFDPRWQMFVARRGQREVIVGPHSAERRLGIIARLAAKGVQLEQILTVAAVVIAHPAGPGAAVVPPVRATRGSAVSAAGPLPTGSEG